MNRILTAMVFGAGIAGGYAAGLGLWQVTDLPARIWGATALSGDAAVWVAADNNGVVWVSTNASGSWATNSAFSIWRTAACSSNGTVVLAGSNWGNIGVSTNSGQTWSMTGPYPDGGPGAGVTSVACSADGRAMAAVMAAVGGTNGPLYLSADSGSTWTAAKLPGTAWYGVAMSADGRAILAVGQQVYESRDSGVSWKPMGVPSFDYWQQAAMSADGSKLVVASSATAAGGVYVSTDSGLSWSLRPVGAYLSTTALAYSGDGTKLVLSGAVSSPRAGAVFVSTDFGATWNLDAAAPGQLSSIALSADGTKLLGVMGQSGGSVMSVNVYQAQYPPTRQVFMDQRNGNFVLWWSSALTNFGIEATADLTSSWTAMTPAPVYNQANYRAEMELPPTNASGFFRLAPY